MISLIKVLLLALIGALIGWVTNIIAIKLIFRPLNPIIIPLFNIKIQGLIPKRREEIAKSIGEVIETELISIDVIINKVVEKEKLSEVIFLIKRKVNGVIEEKIPAFIPLTFKKMIYSYIDDLINEQGERVIKDLVERMVHKATTEVRLSQIVEEKVNSFELEEMERIIIDVAKRELKHIEILGGILGFIIGILQGIIVLYF